MRGKAKDITGQRFERLVVNDRAENSKSGRARWNCVCDCGSKCVVDGSDLRRGYTRSCGCLNREASAARGSERFTKHGLMNHYLYNTWRGINQRISQPNHKHFKDYGGRGIQLCDTWKNDPEAFITWILENLGERPKGMSLDRINNDGDYEPGNLRWATASEQNANRRTTQTKPMEMTNV